MSLDQLQLHVPTPSTRGQYQQVEILVNGVALLDLVSKSESPFIEAERASRVREGEGEAELGWLKAGSYMYPTVAMLSSGKEDFFGPIEDCFRLDADDPSRGKIAILDCECGSDGCWPLVASIERGETVISWSDFRQFHRDWVLNLGPFRFDREQYEQEFARFRRSAQ